MLPACYGLLRRCCARGVGAIGLDARAGALPPNPALPRETLMTTSLSSLSRPSLAGTAPAPQAVPSAQGWLLRPWVDLLFVVNIGWPVIALFAAACSTTTAYKAFGFMLAYFVIMPHRWLTLPLVFFDRP